MNVPALFLSVCSRNTRSKVKLGHWDPEIRSLSAKSLGQLSRLDATLTVSNLREILVHCMSSIPNLRHGSLLAIGEIVQAHIFHNSSQDLPTDLVTEITEIILKLEKGRMFRCVYSLLYLTLTILPRLAGKEGNPYAKPLAFSFNSSLELNSQCRSKLK